MTASGQGLETLRLYTSGQGPKKIAGGKKAIKLTKINCFLPYILFNRIFARRRRNFSVLLVSLEIFIKEILVQDVLESPWSSFSQSQNFKIFACGERLYTKNVQYF